MRKQFIVLLSFVLVIARIAYGQERVIPHAVQHRSSTEQLTVSARAEVLVLGTYHMANRGHDIYNLHADDVLTRRRQAEIAQLIQALKKFNPKKLPSKPTWSARTIRRQMSVRSNTRTILSGSMSFPATRLSKSASGWPRNWGTRQSTQ